MSEWDFPEPEEMAGGGGGTYLDQPGTYHLLIQEVRDGCGPKGNPIEGFSIECEVLAGTTEDCAGKKIGLTVWKPNLAGSEKQIAMEKRIGAAFFIAGDLINPNQLGKSGAVDPNNSQGRQFVAKLVRSKKDGEETKFLQFNYSDIYHVDDPEVAGVPKCAEGLAVVPKDRRHKEDYFTYKAKKKTTPAPTPAASSDQFADL